MNVKVTKTAYEVSNGQETVIFTNRDEAYKAAYKLVGETGNNVELSYVAHHEPVEVDLGVLSGLVDESQRTKTKKVLESVMIGIPHFSSSKIIGPKYHPVNGIEEIETIEIEDK